MLTRITAPVLLLHGSDTVTSFKKSAHYLSEHLANARVKEIEGAAHWSPKLAPHSIAREFIGFFEAILKRT